VHDRNACEPTSVSEQKSAREVVGRVDDRVGHADELARRVGKGSPPEDFDIQRRPPLAEGTPRGVGLARTEVRLLEKKLPVQILELDRVLVGDDQLAETRFGERDRCGRADAARSDEQHA
jgi:hypothetical protein